MLTQGGIFKIFLVLLTITVMAISCSDGDRGGNKLNPKAPVAPVPGSGEEGAAAADVSACEASGGVLNPESGECEVVEAPVGPALGAACQQSAQCEANEYCHPQRGCQPKCQAAADCGFHETCQDNRCVAWAIDSVPGLADAANKKPDLTDISKDINDIAVQNGTCWDELDCKAVENCVGAIINGHNAAGNATGFAGHCAADPNIGGVCNAANPCHEGYNCKAKAGTRLSYCEKTEMCPAGRELDDQGYCVADATGCAEDRIRNAAGVCVLRCPVGSHTQWNGLECQAMDAQACSANEHWDGQDCVTCPRGQVYEGGSCQVPCPAGEQRTQDGCVQGNQQVRHTQSIDIVVETSSVNMQAAQGPTNPVLEFSFCPPFLNGNEPVKNYPEIFGNQQCIKKELPLTIGDAVAEHVMSGKNFILNDMPINNLFYFSAKLKYDGVPAASSSLTLHGLKIGLNFNDGSKSIHYKNPCVSRKFSRNQTVYLSKNDTALCVTMKVANYDDADAITHVNMSVGINDRNADMHIYGRGRADLPPLVEHGLFGTPYANINGNSVQITLPTDRIVRPPQGGTPTIYYYGRNQTYQYGYNFLDTDNISDSFSIVKLYDDGLGLQNVRFLKFSPGSVAADGSIAECSSYNGNNNLPGADHLAGGALNIYWMDSDSPYVNIFPRAGQQDLNSGRAVCQSGINDLSSNLNTADIAD